MMKKIVEYKNLIISAIMFILLFSLTIGYAIFYKDLGLNGNISLLATGDINIIAVNLDSKASPNTLSKFGSINYDEATKNMLLNFNIAVSKEEKTYQSTYLVSVYNSSSIDMIFTGLAINPVIEIKKGTADNTSANVSYTVNTSNKNHNLNVGETIAPGETRVIAIDLKIYVASETSGEIGVGGGGEASSSIDESGELIGTMTDTTLDLRGDNKIECFNIEVINTYKFDRTFNVLSSNSNFALVDRNGNALPSFSIGKPDESNSSNNDKTYEVCIKTKDTAIFMSDTAKTSILLSSSGLDDKTIGNLNLAVDIYEEPINDTNPPEIANVSMTVNAYNQTTKVLPINVSWDLINVTAEDTAVNEYFVLLYDQNTNNLVKTFETFSGNTNYLINLDESFLSSNETNMVNNNHNYYVRVYGIDDALNNGHYSSSGTDNCSGNSNNYCPTGASQSLKWKFNVDTSGLSNMKLSNSSSKVVYYKNTYTATLTPNTDYSLPTEITVSMGEDTLTSGSGNDYTYSSASDSDNLKITKPITDDIILSGSARYSGGGCLIEGTKIKTINGYKNVEDITYKDLLAVYSYELGKEVYEYPIAIEHGGKTDEFKKITFSDNSSLDVYYDHGIFSLDANKYVSINDNKNFHKGTKILKFSDNKFKTVEVEKIETIKKPTNFYNITSTRYLNVIANDYLTVDYLLPISNIFTFNKDITWGKDRDKYLKTKDFIPYSFLKKYFPLHIYKGIRLKEAKYLLNKKAIDVDQYVKEFKAKNFVDPYKDQQGNNLWPVSTSDEINKEVKLYKEGSYYKLKQPKKVSGKKFKGWYNSADNKYYQPKDKVSIDYGIYFEAVWK